MTIGRHFRAQNRNGGGGGARKSRQSFFLSFQKQARIRQDCNFFPSYQRCAARVLRNVSHDGSTRWRIPHQTVSTKNRPLSFFRSVGPPPYLPAWLRRMLLREIPLLPSPSLLVAAVIMQANILVLSLYQLDGVGLARVPF